MWQATRKAAELIKLVTYCNNVNAYCVNLATHAQQQKIEKTQNLAESYKKPARRSRDERSNK